MELLPYDYSPIVDRKALRWPKGARVAVIITVNLEAWDVIPNPSKPYEGPGAVQVPIPPGYPNYANYTWREYGHRIGVFRLIDLFHRHGLFSSASLNAAVGEKFPATIREAKRRGWEFVAHSYQQNELLTNYVNDSKGEEALIDKTLRKFKEVVGQRAEGWLSPSLSPTASTLGILSRKGMKFFCDYVNDDQPYLLKLNGKNMVSIPYAIALNDYTLCVHDGYTSREFSQSITDAFDVFYREGGRIMNIGLHPHISGQAFRLVGIDKAIRYIRKHEKVWFPRRKEIADWYLDKSSRDRRP